MAGDPFDRIGLVVHPRRKLDRALATVRDWAEHQGAELIQLDAPGQEQVVAPRGEVGACDLVMALGGDGTTLAALRAAAPLGRPVMGVACGSLGALTTVTAGDLDDALDRVSRGDYEQRTLPALVAEQDGRELCALNDLVLVRDGAGQVMFEVQVDGERFIRLAGDGLVVATPLGSTAYTLAAGGPMLTGGATGLVTTPLSPHGGVCPPLVSGADRRVTVLLDSGNGGARVELDGQVRAELGAREQVRFDVRLEPEFATLVSLGEEESPIAGLRRRRILTDSPRVLARDDREAQGRSQPAAPDASSSDASDSSVRSEPRAPIS